VARLATIGGRAAIAGVPVDLDVAPGAVHRFETWAAGTQLARDHTARAHGWLRLVLEGHAADLG
jgi:hypothetical protein